MLEFKLTSEEIEEAAKKLPQRLIREGAFDSLVRCLQPTITAMREEVPVDQGDLKASIGFRARRYRGGKTLYGTVGPRKGVWGKGRSQPSKIAHLIENGHFTRRAKSTGKFIGKKSRAVAVVTWVPPNAFSRRAWLRTKDQVLRIFRERFGRHIEIEVRNRKAGRKSK